MKNFYLLIIIVIISTTTYSQSCLPDGITFTTQAEIDNFQTNYPGCTQIGGMVKIKGNNITNLDGLSVLSAIEGSLLIGNIGGNPSLISILGLSNVTSVGGDIEISANNALLSIEGLNSLTSINGNLMIYNNKILKNLTGFENVTSINIGLYICGNKALKNLDALSNLTHIGGCLNIGRNNDLKSLSGLDNLPYLGGDLIIWSNNNLTNIMALNSIEENSIFLLDIIQNPLLTTCEVKCVCDLLNSPNSEILINNNAIGCNTQQEVEEACRNIDVPEINTKSKISIYPNPTENEIFISVKEGIIINEVKIYNQIGQKVRHKKSIANSFDVSMLRQGVYIVELVTDNSRIREKLIIR